MKYYRSVYTIYRTHEGCWWDFNQNTQTWREFTNKSTVKMFELWVSRKTNPAQELSEEAVMLELL